MSTYHQTTGFRRGFEYLRSRGIVCDRVTEAARRPAVVALPALFINLVSSERPPFWFPRSLPSGRSSLGRVAPGDHRPLNCYWHTSNSSRCSRNGHRVADRHGMQEPPYALGTVAPGSRSRDSSASVTTGLERLACRPAAVSPALGRGLSSERSWLTLGPRASTREERAGLPGIMRGSGERSGPLGVVMARTWTRPDCRRRDENMLGDAFINYADNYRLWLNAMPGCWTNRDSAPETLRTMAGAANRALRRYTGRLRGAGTSAVLSCVGC